MDSWKLDPDHSELIFSVKHLMMVNTTGKIERFSVSLNTLNQAIAQWKFDLHAEINSLNTLHTIRDKRLKEKDFLHAEQYPKMRFQTINMQPKNTPDEFKLSGKLTLKGKTHPVSLDAHYRGTALDSFSGEHKMGWRIFGELDRRDWGIDFNLPFKGEGVTIGNTIALQAELEFKKLS